MTRELSKRVWIWVSGLGLAGLLPFFTIAGFAAFGVSPDSQQMAEVWIYVYGLSVVAFIGAISFGFALADPHATDQTRILWLVWSVCPSLLGCAALFLPQLVRPLALSAVAIVALAFDFRMGALREYSSRWLHLRSVLTAGMVLSLWTVTALGAYQALSAQALEILFRAG
jgi:hypothetical protein